MLITQDGVLLFFYVFVVVAVTVIYCRVKCAKHTDQTIAFRKWFFFAV